MVSLQTKINFQDILCMPFVVVYVLDHSKVISILLISVILFPFVVDGNCAVKSFLSACTTLWL